MSQRIIKKVLPDYFQDIVDGKKNYELRLNDFEVERGAFWCWKSGHLLIQLAGELPVGF